VSAAGQELVNRYCAEFILGGPDLDAAKIKIDLSAMGDSLIVMADKNIARVHVHTADADKVLAYAGSLGVLSKIKVDDMRHQHQSLAEVSGALVSTVAVVLGQGFKQIFLSLGADKVVEGGQTANPTVGELLEAVKSAPTANVIVLANNPNVISAAKQAALLSAKDVFVACADSPAAGVAAILALKREAGLTDNLAAMDRAAAKAKTGEVIAAGRTCRFKDRDIRAGDVMGFIGRDLSVVGADCDAVLAMVLESMVDERDEIITVFYGSQISGAQAEQTRSLLGFLFPGREIELHDGGQPNSAYAVLAQ